MPLFHPRSLEKHARGIPVDAGHIDTLKRWADNLARGVFDIETQGDGRFIQRILGDVLGYVARGDAPKWTASKNQPLGGGNVDVALGNFCAESVQIIAPLELKGAKTNLDIIAGRGETPVQQAWRYANAIENAKWVLVSNFREIRLYAYGKGTRNYESFDLASLHSDIEQYQRFILLLSAENLLGGKTLSLLNESEKTEKEITDQLYKEYKALRVRLIETISKDNPDQDKLDIIRHSQKILDRVLFIAFAEDTDLLPEKTLEQAFVTVNPFNPLPVWENFKGLFRAINEGNALLKIPEYNGGLFADDPGLNALKVSDKLCEGFKEIGEYDFDTEISVDILGHIFEQSISDLEELRAAVEEAADDRRQAAGKTKSKRKTDGVFYTPPYITQYIVEQTVGGWLADRRKEIGFDTLPELSKKNVTAHIAAWEAYKTAMSNIKVLDPACGSGAFLIEVFDYLCREGKRINEELTRLHGGQQSLFRWDTHILANNLYGVDLNRESVEITKLSLWLKTANRGEKLTYLENNIKVGNSLIDDKSVAGELAFDWNEQFQDIMANGGFDVVVGNPPYVFLRNNNMDEGAKVFYREKYLLYSLKPRTDVYFFERSFSLLKEGGYLGFIAPNNLLTIGSLKDFREYILKNFGLINLVNSRDKVFVSANVDTMMMSLRKSVKKQSITVWELRDGEFYFVGKHEQERFLTGDCIISYELFSDPQKAQIVEKIETHSTSLKNLCKVSNGIVVYKINNGTPPQTREMAERKIYHSKRKEGVEWLPYIEGSDLKRYDFSWSGTFVKYGENIAERRSKVTFDKSRILVRIIPSKPPYSINGMLLTEYSINDQNYIVLFSATVPLPYILGLLNSRLISFWFVNKLGKMQRGLFPQLKAGELGDFPLKPYQDVGIEKAVTQILENEKLLQRKRERFRHLVSDNLPGVKMTDKRFDDLVEFKDFLDELKKQKKSIALSEQGEWRDVFHSTKQTITSLSATIRQTDDQIDRMVYNLYGLTEAEIALVENRV